MCLVALAWQAHPEFELIVAANRDEFHRRPASEAQWWDESPDVLAGRDQQAGGSWLAVSRKGRFATVTNYREQSFTRGDYRSRGMLVTSFVSGTEVPTNFAAGIDGDDYAGFNLLVADRKSIAFLSNRSDVPTHLDPGVYGLSNASLDTPWSKLVRSRRALAERVESDSVNPDTLFDLLQDRATADEDVNSEHLPREHARAITAPFIVTDEYGTRSSTVFMRRYSGESHFVERRFDAAGECTGTSEFTF